MTTDGASNFKCALKRHGDDYETFEQLMTSLDGGDEELFYLDLDDLQCMWNPVDEITTQDDDVLLMEDSTLPGGSGESDTGSNGFFQIHEFPEQILHKVIDKVLWSANIMNIINK